MDTRDRQRIITALDHWITVKLEQQTLSQASGRAQGGTRGSVTGGRHLAGVNQLILDQLDLIGVPDVECYANRGAVLPGYIRASKSWDLLVVVQGEPALAVEYKSMTGSEGKNLNNRADEVIGVAEDLRLAQAHGLISENLRRAYVFLMEVTPAVQVPVGVAVSAGSPDEEFVGASYLERMAIMCERLRDEGLYDLTWAVGVKRDPTDFVEPRASVGWDVFSRDLAQIFTV